MDQKRQLSWSEKSNLQFQKQICSEAVQSLLILLDKANKSRMQILNSEASHYKCSKSSQYLKTNTDMPRLAQTDKLHKKNQRKQTNQTRAGVKERTEDTDHLVDLWQHWWDWDSIPKCRWWRTPKPTSASATSLSFSALSALDHPERQK